MLSKINVLVSSDNKQFVHYWTKVCKAAGAIILSDVTVNSPSYCGCSAPSKSSICCYIVSDVRTSAFRLKLKRDQTLKHRIAWVSVEFIIQCLINQQILNFEANQQYKM